MTDDEIIELAEMAGLIGRPGGKLSKALKEFEQEHFDMLIAFAKLIADHEREECVKRASVALLGTLQTTRDRVLKAIKGEKSE